MNSEVSTLKKKLIGIIMLKGIWFHFITFHILSKNTFYLIDNENFKRKKFSFKIFQNNKKVHTLCKDHPRYENRKVNILEIL